MTEKRELDFDEHWSVSLETYRAHPTSRHRRRYVLRTLARHGLPSDTPVFDFGCGPGLLLEEIGARFSLSASRMAGCDISGAAIANARKRLPEGTFFQESLPETDTQYGACIASEVIEHTPAYPQILAWMAAHLKPDGLLVITTQGGSLQLPDAYYGHTQHFEPAALRGEIETLGCRILEARQWGWPFYTLQKHQTAKNFEAIRQNFMEGELTTKRKLVFHCACALYYLHDLIPAGPQLFFTARKEA
jgi:SAM-dependent methyltransferase